MSPFRTVAVAVTLLFSLQIVSAQAQTDQHGRSDEIEAPAFEMVGDLLIARPLLTVATAAGLVLFIVSLPFTALGGNVAAAGDALVGQPGRAAFVRCLGCPMSYDAAE